MSGVRIIRRLTICAILFIASVISSAVSAATITVDDWIVGVIADTPDEWFEDVSDDVTNPFNALLTAAAPPAFSASATHAFSWSDSAASFRIDAELAVPDLPAPRSGESLSSGQIYFTAEQDLLLSMDAALHYDFPPHKFDCWLIVAVRTVDPFGSLFNYNKSVRSSDYVHTSGTLTTTTEDLLLSAGGRYRLSYNMWMNSFGDNTDSIATGDGHMQFTLLPVPEPTTAMLLFAAAIPVIARRRRKP